MTANYSHEETDDGTSVVMLQAWLGIVNHGVSTGGLNIKHDNIISHGTAPGVSCCVLAPKESAGVTNVTNCMGFAEESSAVYGKRCRAQLGLWGP